MARILLGLILIIFGLNGFFAFLPLPEKQGFALEFLHTLRHSGYIFPMVATIMTTSGVLLLLNRWVGFALLIFLPISVNIFAFHLFHDQQGLVAAGPLFGLTNFLIFRNLKKFKELFV